MSEWDTPGMDAFRKAHSDAWWTEEAMDEAVTYRTHRSRLMSLAEWHEAQAAEIHRDVLAFDAARAAALADEQPDATALKP